MKRFVVPREAKSWLPVEVGSHFPIQNLPFCLASYGGVERVCTRIGDFLVDLTTLGVNGALGQDLAWPYGPDALKHLAESGAASRVREEVFQLLVEGDGVLQSNDELRESAVIPVHTAKLLCPMAPRAFVDFYSGINHASNVGKMFRPDQPPLLPNYRHLPVGYNGRGSTVFVSGKDVVRPSGQQKIGDDVVFGPTKELDFELEMGFFVANGNPLGKPIPVEQAEDHMFGFVLVNDWSARDVQRWEYQPLGPFLAKSFATSVSPYVVTLDALEPFRCEGVVQDPTPLPHLAQPPMSHLNIELEVSIKTSRMTSPQVVCRTNSRELYWSFAQQLAHQASNGTLVETGDLYASGTISGPEPGTYGSLLELTWRGTQPIMLEETGEQRTFLQDGDQLTMTGWGQGDGYRVGFGEVSAKIIPWE